jgi:hypothetical protein
MRSPKSRSALPCSTALPRSESRSPRPLHKSTRKSADCILSAYLCNSALRDQNGAFAGQAKQDFEAPVAAALSVEMVDVDDGEAGLAARHGYWRKRTAASPIVTSGLSCAVSCRSRSSPGSETAAGRRSTAAIGPHARSKRWWSTSACGFSSSRTVFQMLQLEMTSIGRGNGRGYR